MKTHDIEDRAFRFACRVVEMEKRLARSATVKPPILKQATSSATAIGSNLEEARGAQSRGDFHAKIHISLKEAREAKYWLRVVENTSGLPAVRFASLIKEASELVAMLTTIAKKTNPEV